MKLTKQHKIYAGLVAIALIALICDRTVFKPSDAIAISMNEYAVNASDPADADAGNVLLVAENSLANRLKTVAAARKADPRDVRDILTSPWMEPTPDMPALSLHQAGYDFMRRHRLNAVMGSGGSGYVVIDGKCLRVGQEFDGCTLKSVLSRSALFESMSNGEQFEFALGWEHRSETSSPPVVINP